MTPYIAHLKDGTLPEDQNKARYLKYKAARFFLENDQLYRRTFSAPTLKCVDPEEANYCLREVHEGIYRDHLAAKALAYKVIIQGYYWPTIHADVVAYMKKCSKCQKFSNVSKQSPSLPGKMATEDLEFVSIEEGFQLFCEGYSFYGPYWEHILGFWKASLQRPVLRRNTNSDDDGDEQEKETSDAVKVDTVKVQSRTEIQSQKKTQSTQVSKDISHRSNMEAALVTPSSIHDYKVTSPDDFPDTERVIVIHDSVKTEEEEILFRMELRILSAYVEAINAKNFKEEEIIFDREERAHEEYAYKI
ncbi:hypothetical protein AgCh_009335 [Apium graveolens]